VHHLDRGAESRAANTPAVSWLSTTTDPVRTLTCTDRIRGCASRRLRIADVTSTRRCARWSRIRARPGVRCTRSAVGRKAISGACIGDGSRYVLERVLYRKRVSAAV
jgi:hypothetical protein